MKTDILFFSFLAIFASAAAQQPTEPMRLSIEVAHSVLMTNATAALGGSIDGHEQGSTKAILSPKSVEKMLQSGLKPLAYRLRTELGVEAWHWNPHGNWSDATNQCGYWTSATKMEGPIKVSYGYRLPRRGDTLDEANNDGYSRLDDANPDTFWKSNPYLTSYYTGEPDWKHPQWVIVDFGKKVWINAARLHWKDPYAKKFRIQYAHEGAIYFGNNKPWHDFPRGKVNDGRGGSPLLDLGALEHVQFIRILMTESSEMKKNQSLAKGVLMLNQNMQALKSEYALSGTDPFSDLRDHVGYALQEVELGVLQNGIFQDHIIHSPDQHQTMMTVSSTDPWHRASDIDSKTEQPGVDIVVSSGLGNDQPILWSLPVLYDTPENAASLVDYLKKRNNLKPHQRIELGEEPDGQHIDPKDFGELYCQVVKKIRNLQPITSKMQPMLGGPSFVTADYQPKDTTYRFDHRLWLKPFLKELRHHHREKDFQFLSFEWYPFDDLLLPAPELLCKQSGSLRRAMTLLRNGGVSKKMPMLITEYGYSVFSGEPEVKVEAALLNAEMMAEFLASGGTTAYLYGYEPNNLECGVNGSWGNLMMFLEKNDFLIPLPTFYSAQMMAGLIKKGTEIFLVKSPKQDLIAYAFHQKYADEWNFLIINKNPTTSYQVLLKHQGPLEKISYSSKNYQWHADGPNGAPSKNKPPQRELISAGASIVIEPWSLTVLKIKKPGRLSRVLEN